MSNFSSATHQGMRDYQEDRFVTLEIPDGLLMAVIDGHGGALLAEALRAAIPACWEQAQKATSGEDPLRTLQQFFKYIDWANSYSQGACLSLVWIPAPASKAYVAVLGDTPVIIKDSAGQYWYAPEHNARINEKERQEATARGLVYQYGYMCNPITGNGVQLTRCLGDSDFGQMLNRDPEFFCKELGAESWVLVGSDGLVNPSHKFGNVWGPVVKRIEEGATAEDLAAFSLSIPTGDNVTAVLWRK